MGEAMGNMIKDICGALVNRLEEIEQEVDLCTMQEGLGEELEQAALHLQHQIVALKLQLQNLANELPVVGS